MAESRAVMASFFASAEWVDEDAAFSIIRCAKADKHPDAVMLSAGIYRDENDQSWTLPVVTKVKERIHNDPSLNHDYLPIPGDPLFLKGARSVALGTKYCLDPRIASVQTVAGTGANHVGALLLARSIKPKQVWFSSPTWINHPLIWEKAWTMKPKQETSSSYKPALTIPPASIPLENSGKPSQLCVIVASCFLSSTQHSKF
jgi:aspartate/tyrosine/aromatic aminotransferase